MGIIQIHVHLSRQIRARVDSYEMNGSWSGNLNSNVFCWKTLECRVMLAGCLHVADDLASGRHSPHCRENALTDG